MMDRLNHALGTLVGLAAGDAIGMPASFMTPAEVRRVYGKITGFVSPAPNTRAHAELQPGQVTDDTMQTLLLAEVLVEKGEVDVGAFAAKLVAWAKETNILASNLIGPSTRRFLENAATSPDLEKCFQFGETNGAAMRVAPVGIKFSGDLSRTVAEVYKSCLPSHGSNVAIAGACGIACAVAAGVGLSADGGPLERKEAVQRVMSAALYGAEEGEKLGREVAAPSVAERIRWAREVVDRHAGEDPAQVAEQLYRSIGAGMRACESVPFSLGVFYLAQGQPREGILLAANMGDDADTNASLVGGLCGAFSGVGSIPPEFQAAVARTNNLDLATLAARLISGDHAASPGLDR
jgi:ADP-ribosylglycohydrolase